jgi:transforming growth factor-beta-induced protein
VFAPTNAAFTAAGDVIATLTNDQITDVLLYHVVGNASAMSTDLTVNEKLATLFAPHQLTVATIQPNVTIQPDGTGAADATVTGANNVACNGVVHIVDAVLVPDLAAPVTTPAPANVTTPGPVTTTPAATMNIVELAQTVPSLSTLVTLLVQQNLTDVLSGTGPFTVFAPNDDAFAAAADITAGLTSEQLTEVLTYHVIGQVEALAADLTKDESLTTLFTGHDLTVATITPNVTIHPDGGADATVIGANNMATNGVVHIVNAVLVPALSAASFNLQVV